MGETPATPDPGVPRWVKVFGVVGLVLVVVVVVMLFSGHGPSQHASGAGHAAAPATWADEGGSAL